MDKSADAYRTISEVAEDLKLPQHVLRFWETRFPQIKPMKRGGGRRFYTPADVELLRAIKTLLYGDGYTIKGVQRILREQGPRAVASLATAEGRIGPGPGPEPAEAHMRVKPEPDMECAKEIAPDADLDFDPAGDMIFSDRDGAPWPGSDRAAAAIGDPDPNAVEDSISAEAVSERLQAVLFDLAECARILRAARGSS